MKIFLLVFVAAIPTYTVSITSIVETPPLYSTHTSFFEDMNPSLSAIEGPTTLEDSFFMGGYSDTEPEEVVLVPAMISDTETMDPEDAKIVPILRHMGPYGAPPSPILHVENIERSDLLYSPVLSSVYASVGAPVVFTDKSEDTIVEYDDVIASPIDFAFTDW